MPHADHASVGARRWAVEQALPLWADAGFDLTRGLFYERLDYERTPIALPALRLMVQARQIATYARAALLSWHDGAEKALTCLGTIRRLYHRADDAPGWVFSIGSDGRPADKTRDLYAHAFVLYALAWSYRLTHDKDIPRLADQTLAEMDQIFAAPNGGYRDTDASSLALRSQNPHMHLFEALLALADASGLEHYLTRAEALCALACNRFVTPAGALIEEFDAGWKPLQPPGKNRVEPGHIFEWACLLSEFERLSGRNMSDVRNRLFDFGIRHGIDPQTGLVFDAIDDNGVLLADTLRLWPQSERIRTLALLHRLGDNTASDSADRLIRSVTQAFSLDRLKGGWVDQCDREHNRRVDYMPASSLYHIMGAVFEADTAFGKTG